MGNLLRPGNVRVITKDGEVVINLVLDININLNNGGITVSQMPLETELPEKEDTQWEIPDFVAPNTKLNFGKTVDKQE
jgi:hypothetical protein